MDDSLQWKASENVRLTKRELGQVFFRLNAHITKILPPFGHRNDGLVIDENAIESGSCMRGSMQVGVGPPGDNFSF